MRNKKSIFEMMRLSYGNTTMSSRLWKKKKKKLAENGIKQ